MFLEKENLRSEEPSEKLRSKSRCFILLHLSVFHDRKRSKTVSSTDSKRIDFERETL